MPMHSVESITSAIVDFFKSVKYAGVLRDYELHFEPAPFLNDEAQEATHKALQHLVERLTSQVTCFENEQAEVQKNASDGNKQSSDEVLGKVSSRTKTIDPHVQLKVDRDELDRRIACFTTRKRKEIEETNCKLFCNNVLLDEDDPLFDQVDSCARVDAIYVGKEKQIKVTRVDNCWGPQTVPTGFTPVTVKQEPPDDDVVLNMPKDFEERLRNVESHLNFEPESKQRKYLYTWLKELEDRILYLESLSPEYFSHKDIRLSSPQKKSRMEKIEMLSNLSIEELDRRKQQLKEELKYKSNRRVQSLH